MHPISFFPLSPLTYLTSPPSLLIYHTFINSLIYLLTSESLTYVISSSLHPSPLKLHWLPSIFPPHLPHFFPCFWPYLFSSLHNSLFIKSICAILILYCVSLMSVLLIVEYFHTVALILLLSSSSTRCLCTHLPNTRYIKYRMMIVSCDFLFLKHNVCVLFSTGYSCTHIHTWTPPPCSLRLSSSSDACRQPSCPSALCAAVCLHGSAALWPAPGLRHPQQLLLLLLQSGPSALQRLLARGLQV